MAWFFDGVLGMILAYFVAVCGFGHRTNTHPPVRWGELWKRDYRDLLMFLSY